MTDKEILVRALNKAADNGSIVAKQYLEKINAYRNQPWSINIVFKVCCLSHDFAKAFWPDDSLDDFIKSVGAKKSEDKVYKLEYEGHKCFMFITYQSDELTEIEIHPCDSNARLADMRTHITKEFMCDKWKTHLQEMVVEENPIQYLKQFL